MSARGSCTLSGPVWIATRGGTSCLLGVSILVSLRVMRAGWCTFSGTVLTANQAGKTRAHELPVRILGQFRHEVHGVTNPLGWQVSADRRDDIVDIRFGHDVEGHRLSGFGVLYCSCRTFADPGQGCDACLNLGE